PTLERSPAPGLARRRAGPPLLGRPGRGRPPGHADVLALHVERDERPRLPPPLPHPLAVERPAELEAAALRAGALLRRRRRRHPPGPPLLRSRQLPPDGRPLRAHGLGGLAPLRAALRRLRERTCRRAAAAPRRHRTRPLGRAGRAPPLQRQLALGGH